MYVSRIYLIQFRCRKFNFRIHFDAGLLSWSCNGCIIRKTNFCGLSGEVKFKQHLPARRSMLPPFIVSFTKELLWSSANRFESTAILHRVERFRSDYTWKLNLTEYEVKRQYFWFALSTKHLFCTNMCCCRFHYIFAVYSVINNALVERTQCNIDNCQGKRWHFWNY